MIFRRRDTAHGHQGGCGQGHGDGGCQHGEAGCEHGNDGHGHGHDGHCAHEAGAPAPGEARQVTAVPDRDGQRAGVVVRSGYHPARVLARPALPLRLAFDRQEDTPCSARVVAPALGIDAELAAFATTVVEVPAPRPGRYEFTCGMGMMRGTVEIAAVTAGAA